MNLQKNRDREFMTRNLLKAEKISFETLISKKELSSAFSISCSFVNKLMAEEGLPHFKIGRAVRFRISDIANWLEKHRNF